MQKEIDVFLNKVFAGFPSQTFLTFDDYCHVNKRVSSEMFYSLLSLLHDRLPCSPNCFRLKRVYRERLSQLSGSIENCLSPAFSQSPVTTIASPSTMKCLGIYNSANAQIPYL
jgi:hypothetical protein